MAWWGARGRGHRINQRIEADLDNHGPTTVPSFRKVTSDSKVTLVTKSAEEIEGPEVMPEPVGEEDEEVDVGLTVGNLPSAPGGVETVTVDASLDEAVTKMLLNVDPDPLPPGSEEKLRNFVKLLKGFIE